MVQNASWEWLLRGFKIDLETRLKPRTVKDYCDHVSYFARWAQDNNKRDPRSVTKRDIQEFLHFVASTPAIFVTGNRAKRRVQRDENSRWHHYFPLKRFFAWAVNEGYLEQNPMDGIVLKPPKAAPIEPYKPHQEDPVRVPAHSLCQPRVSLQPRMFRPDPVYLPRLWLHCYV